MEFEGYIRGKSHFDGAIYRLGELLMIHPMNYSLTVYRNYRGSTLVMPDMGHTPNVRIEESEDSEHRYAHFGWESGEIHNEETIETPWFTVYLVELNSYPNLTHILVHLCARDDMVQTDEWAYLGAVAINPHYLLIEAQKRPVKVTFEFVPVPPADDFESV